MKSKSRKEYPFNTTTRNTITTGIRTTISWVPDEKNERTKQYSFMVTSTIIRRNNISLSSLSNTNIIHISNNIMIIMKQQQIC